jgi:serine protease Do
MSLSEEARQKFDLGQAADGVVITGVDQSGTAAQKGLSEGDVIVEVDQEKVSSPSDVAERVAAAKREGYRVVTLLVYSGGDHRFVAVEIGKG